MTLGGQYASRSFQNPVKDAAKKAGIKKRVTVPYSAALPFIYCKPAPIYISSKVCWDMKTVKPQKFRLILILGDLIRLKGRLKLQVQILE